MTVTSGFFNSINHDRRYDAEQLSSIFDGIINDGVYQGYGEAFAVTVYPGAKNTIVIGTGRAWFDHTWILNDSRLSMVIDDYGISASRIDAVVLDIDRRESVRNNSIKIIKGSYSSKPSPPALIKEDLHNQYPIAYITTPTGLDANLTNGNISNMVGTEQCPFVTGIIEAVNASIFYQQLEAQFNLWWNNIKDMVGDEGLVDYRPMIEKLEDKIDNVSSASISSEDIEKGKNVTITKLFDTFGGSGVTGLVDGFLLPDGKTLLVYIDDDSDTSTVRIYTSIVGTNGVKGSETTIATISTDRSSVGTTDIPEIPGLDKGTVFGSGTVYLHKYYVAPVLISIDTDSYPASVRIGFYIYYLLQDNTGGFNEGYGPLFIGHDTKAYNITVNSSGVVSYTEIGGSSSLYNIGINLYGRDTYSDVKGWGSYIPGHTVNGDTLISYVQYLNLGSSTQANVWLSIMNSSGVLTKFQHSKIDNVFTKGIYSSPYEIVPYSNPDETGIYVADNANDILYIYDMYGNYSSYVRNDFSGHPCFSSDYVTSGSTDIYFRNGDKFQKTTNSFSLDGESFDYPVFFDRFVYPNDQATPSGSPSASIIATSDQKYGFVKYGSNSMMAFIDPSRAYGIYSRVCSSSLNNLISSSVFTALKLRKNNSAISSDGNTYFILSPGTITTNSSDTSQGPIVDGSSTQNADIAIYKISLS